MSKKKTAAETAGSVSNIGEWWQKTGDQISDAWGEFVTPNAETVKWDLIPTGRRFDLTYEPQLGQPIDGGNPQLRNFSPFIIGFDLPPDVAEMYDSDREDLQLDLDQALSNNAKISDTAYAEDFLQEAALQTGSVDRPEASFVGKVQITNYAVQLMNLSKIPELLVLVNPTSMAVTYTKLQDFGTRTRKNRIFRAWGEEQPTITFSFKTGGFIAGQASAFWGPDNPTPSGLQYSSKKLSAAWQNFMKIFQIYQNGALLYDTVFDTEAHLGVGGVYIKYDQMIYKGMIESFDFSYNADSPNSLEFELAFTVSEMEDLSDDGGVVAPLFDPNGEGWPI